MSAARAAIFVLCLGFVTVGDEREACAQTVPDFSLSDRDRAAVGVVTVEVFDRPDGSSADPTGFTFERASGAIRSGEGHVVTAAHIFVDEQTFRICARAEGADPSRSCRISFYPRGEQRSRFDLKIVGERSAERDYILLRLPVSDDAISRPAWPAVTLAAVTVPGERLFLVGYTGDTPPIDGSANVVSVADARLGAAEVGACPGSGWGGARVVSGRTSPGWSGGPVFNAAHRVVGIVLGEACGDGLGAPGRRPRHRASC